MNHHAMSILPLLLLLTLPGGLSKNCTDVRHPNNRFTCQLMQNYSACEDYSWKNGDDVVAHKHDYNESWVLSYGPRNITFKRPPGNVTYMCDHTPIICSCECNPGNDSDPEGPSAEVDFPNNNVGFIIGVVLGVIVVLLAIIGYYLFPQLFGALRERFCRHDYNQANQSPPVNNREEMPEDTRV